MGVGAVNARRQYPLAPERMRVAVAALVVLTTLFEEGWATHRHLGKVSWTK